MAVYGIEVLDFGAFPGKADASIAVAAAGIAAEGSTLVEAWLLPAATADHSADEHVVESIRVIAGNIQAGVGFTIYGLDTNQISEPLVPPGSERLHIANGTAALNTKGPGDQNPSVGGRRPMIYGEWSVAWIYENLV